MITALIVDDEPLARRGLRIRLETFPEVTVVGECANGREALAFCAESPPQLVFLDIQMPGLDGFDVVKGFQSECMPLIVFVTAFDHYAVEAFDVHAVDYLLKPVDEERLAKAIEKVRQKLSDQSVHADKAKLLTLIGDITGKPVNTLEEAAQSPGGVNAGEKATLHVKDGTHTTLVPLDEIDWVEAAGDYMCLHVGDTTHIMRSTMGCLEAQLPTPPFQRIHRSTLVNTQRINQIITHMNGEYILALNCGARLKTGRAFKDKIKALLGSPP